MRKTILGQSTPPAGGTSSDEGWLDLEQVASVEVTSEDPEKPVEGAISLSSTKGWRAGFGGEQLIRIVFDQPVALKQIHLRFEEREDERTQEFVLTSYSSDGTVREIVRQQWNFSPSGSTQEVESLDVNLGSTTALELKIRPDLHRENAVASLAALRLRYR